MTTAQVLNRTVGPVTTPVTLTEAKKQVEVIDLGTHHDDQISEQIQAAAEQVEKDTEHICITQTFQVLLNDFPSTGFIRIPVRPIQSLTSITYLDTNSEEQILSTDVYGLDSVRRQVYLKHGQAWPAITPERNGIVITVIAGYGASATNVPRLIKQAILLQVAKWFQHRGDESLMPAHDTAYERIIRRIARSSYP